MFAEAGVEVDASNKKDVDRVIHGIVGVRYKDCPATWRKLKKSFLADERKRGELVRKLARGLAKKKK